MKNRSNLSRHFFCEKREAREKERKERERKKEERERENTCSSKPTSTLAGKYLNIFKNQFPVSAERRETVHYDDSLRTSKEI